MYSAAEYVNSLLIDDRISPHDTMFAGDPKHYFHVSRSDCLAIVNVLGARSSYDGGSSPVVDIYDFGCGYGRVTRSIRAAFPAANIYVTDLDDQAVQWCERTFGCISTKGEIPSGNFDLIWLGSVFTHLPKAASATLLSRCLAGLAPNGVLAFTTQGRFSFERMRDFDWVNDEREWVHYNLDRERFMIVSEGYQSSGYGYVDYPMQNDYGVCIASPSWYAEQAFSNGEYIQVFFQEKGADNHQDVIAFMRKSVLDTTKARHLWR